MNGRLTDFRRRVESAIGGRNRALAFEKATGGRFKRVTVQSWIDGRTWPDIAELLEFASATGRPLSYFYPPDSAPDEPLREALSTPGRRRTISAFTGIHIGTLAGYASGKTVPPANDVTAILAVARGDIDGPALSPVDSALGAEDLVRIPRLDVEAAAGGGQVVDVVSAIAELPFPREFVDRMAPRGADLQCLQVRGDSMEPTIQNGALIVIDRKQHELPKWKPPARKAPRPAQKKDGIYVFNQSGLVRLKRLRDIGEHFVAIVSDNYGDHPHEIVRLGRDGGIRIIGRVVWWEMRDL